MRTSDDLRRRKTLGVRMMPGGGVFLPMKRVVPLDAMAMVDDGLLSDAGTVHWLNAATLEPA